MFFWSLYRQAKEEFLEKRFKVRATVTFRGRQMAHTYLGRDLLSKLTEEACDAVRDIDSTPFFLVGTKCDLKDVP